MEKKKNRFNDGNRMSKIDEITWKLSRIKNISHPPKAELLSKCGWNKLIGNLKKMICNLDNLILHLKITLAA
jgi:hypothetical protein